MIKLTAIVLTMAYLWAMSILVVAAKWHQAEQGLRKEQKTVDNLWVKHEGYHWVDGLPRPCPPEPNPIQCGYDPDEPGIPRVEPVMRNGRIGKGVEPIPVP